MTGGKEEKGREFFCFFTLVFEEENLFPPQKKTHSSLFLSNHFSRSILFPERQVAPCNGAPLGEERRRREAEGHVGPGRWRRGQWRRRRGRRREPSESLDLDLDLLLRLAPRGSTRRRLDLCPRGQVAQVQPVGLPDAQARRGRRRRHGDRRDISVHLPLHRVGF